VLALAATRRAAALQPTNTRALLVAAVGEWVADQSTATSLYGHISDWDVTDVTDMTDVFRGRSGFQHDISAWDMAGVTTMEGMFQGAAAFNGNLTTWNVGAVASLKNTFAGASAFEGNGLDAWAPTAALLTLEGAFSDAYNFDADLTTWNVGGVGDMSTMFARATAFRGNGLGAWFPTTALLTLEGAFSGATSFDADLSSWDVGGVTTLDSAFSGAEVYAGAGLENWVPSSSLESLRNTFSGALAFDGDVSGWDVSGVTTLEGTFANAAAFNSDVGGWDVSSVITLESTFSGARTFDANLVSWIVASVDNAEFAFADTVAFAGWGVGGWAAFNPARAEGMFRNAVGLTSDPAGVFDKAKDGWDWSQASGTGRTTSAGMFAGVAIDKCFLTGLRDRLPTPALSDLPTAAEACAAAAADQACVDQVLDVSCTCGLEGATYVRGSRLACECPAGTVEDEERCRVSGDWTGTREELRWDESGGTGLLAHGLFPDTTEFRGYALRVIPTAGDRTALDAQLEALKAQDVSTVQCDGDGGGSDAAIACGLLKTTTAVHTFGGCTPPPSVAGVAGDNTLVSNTDWDVWSWGNCLTAADHGDNDNDGDGETDVTLRLVLLVLTCPSDTNTNIDIFQGSPCSLEIDVDATLGVPVYQLSFVAAAGSHEVTLNTDVWTSPSFTTTVDVFLPEGAQATAVTDLSMLWGDENICLFAVHDVSVTVTTDSSDVATTQNEFSAALYNEYSSWGDAWGLMNDNGADGILFRNSQFPSTLVCDSPNSTSYTRTCTTTNAQWLFRTVVRSDSDLFLVCSSLLDNSRDHTVDTLITIDYIFVPEDDQQAGVVDGAGYAAAHEIDLVEDITTRIEDTRVVEDVFLTIDVETDACSAVKAVVPSSGTPRAAPVPDEGGVVKLLHRALVLGHHCWAMIDGGGAAWGSGEDGATFELSLECSDSSDVPCTEGPIAHAQAQLARECEVRTVGVVDSAVAYAADGETPCPSVANAFVFRCGQECIELPDESEDGGLGWRWSHYAATTALHVVHLFDDNDGNDNTAHVVGLLGVGDGSNVDIKSTFTSAGYSRRRMQASSGAASPRRLQVAEEPQEATAAQRLRFLQVDAGDAGAPGVIGTEVNGTEAAAADRGLEAYPLPVALGVLGVFLATWHTLVSQEVVGRFAAMGASPGSRPWYLGLRLGGLVLFGVLLATQSALMLLQPEAEPCPSGETIVPPLIFCMLAVHVFLVELERGWVLKQGAGGFLTAARSKWMWISFASMLFIAVPALEVRPENWELFSGNETGVQTRCFAQRSQDGWSLRLPAGSTWGVESTWPVVCFLVLAVARDAGDALSASSPMAARTSRYDPVECSDDDSRREVRIRRVSDSNALLLLLVASSAYAANMWALLAVATYILSKQDILGTSHTGVAALFRVLSVGTLVAMCVVLFENHDLSGAPSASAVVVFIAAVLGGGTALFGVGSHIVSGASVEQPRQGGRA